MTVVNSGSATITVTGIVFHWPAANEYLKKIEFNGQEIWGKGDSSSPTTIPGEGSWNGPTSRRQVPSGSSYPLKFFFDQEAQSGGYSLELTLSNGCTISRSW